MNYFLAYFGSVLFLVILFSCKEDAEELEADVLGTWQSTDIILSECENADSNSTLTIQCPGNNCIRLTLMVDSSDTRIYIKEFVNSMGSDYKSGEFSVGETRIEFCTFEEGDETCYSSKYYVTNNVLVLQTEGNDQNCLEETKYERIE